MISSRVALGTVQFGMDYGINNTRGKIPISEILIILKTAYQAGIKMLDTASVYGDSESVIGSSLKTSGLKFDFVSKLSGCTDEDSAKRSFEKTLKDLQADTLYGYIFHHFDLYQKHPFLWNVLESLKNEGRIKKMGFSLYRPQELDFLFKKKVRFDLVQVPYSIFDRRFEKEFKKLTDDGVEIHVRSIFLQGLVFKKKSDLTDSFKSIGSKLELLHNLAEQIGISVATLCLGFALLNTHVAKVVLGIDGENHLRETLANFQQVSRVTEIMNKLMPLQEENENILLPQNWTLQPH